jgi:hypothetical protein
VIVSPGTIYGRRKGEEREIKRVPKDFSRIDYQISNFKCRISNRENRNDTDSAI